MSNLIFLALCAAAAFGRGSCQGDTSAYITVVNITGTDVVGGTPVKTVRSVNTQAHSSLVNASLNLGASVTDGDFLVPDVCSTTLHPCDSAATCTNVNSSLIQCRCMSGYTDASTTSYPPETTPVVPSGTNCTDIDECSGNATVCGAETFNCTNSPGSYSCACNPGYELSSNKVCVDIDDCNSTTSPHNCDGNATCANTVGSFTCACNAGYTGDGNSCADENECDTGSHTCDASRATCTNTVGSFTCACNTGFTGDGVTCNDVDECTGGHNCHANATCSNTDGSFTCSCQLGFTGNGTFCEDEDECTTGSHTCHSTWADCTNTMGSFTCACQAGYTGDGMTCNDIDECSTGAHNCDSNANCNNANGSFSCACKAGYSGDGVTCNDIDECMGNATVCGAQTFNCTNTPGSYDCHCNPGYEISNNKICVDIDECGSTSLHNCDVSGNAVCSNTLGSFTCVCDSGYSGDGVTCTDVDECAGNATVCGVETFNCTNSQGSFMCACNPGYEFSNGKVCVDIDECSSATSPHNCDANARCTNTAGNFTCACNAGYTGNGLACTAFPHNYCYRAAINVSGEIATANAANQTQLTSVIEDIVRQSSLMFESFNYSTETTISDANSNTTTIIVLVCFNKTSLSENEFTALLRSFSTNLTVNSHQLNSTDDFDECVTNYGGCSDMASCTNTNGSFSCACTGSTVDLSTNGVPGTICDVDECAVLSNSCANGGTCTNTLGSYECTCLPGYTVNTTGSPIICSDTNECLQTGTCHANATCANSAGSFACTCMTGFTGNGISCQALSSGGQAVRQTGTWGKIVLLLVAGMGSMLMFIYML